MKIGWGILLSVRALGQKTQDLAHTHTHTHTLQKKKSTRERDRQTDRQIDEGASA